jgi:hypothetical protein
MTGSSVLSMSVVDGVKRDLASIAERDPGLAESTLASSALSLAEGMDDPGNSFTSRGIAARELRETMDRLRDLAPEEQKKDGLDDLSAARAKRRQRSAAG